MKLKFFIFFILEKPVFFRAKNDTVSTLRSGEDYCWLYCDCRKDIPSKISILLLVKNCTAHPDAQLLVLFSSPSLALMSLLKIYYSRKEFEWNYYHLSENLTFYLNKISCHLMIFWWRLESKRTREKRTTNPAPQTYLTLIDFS
jgi:hypothetical protein